MKYMSHNDIRNTWYRFFESKGHKKVESAPLVPMEMIVYYGLMLVLRH